MDGLLRISFSLTSYIVHPMRVDLSRAMFSITSRLAVTARSLGQGLLTVSHPFSTASAERKTVLVVGSSGALGSVVAKHLSSSRDMTVVGADVMEIPSAFTGDWEVSHG